MLGSHAEVEGSNLSSFIQDISIIGTIGTFRPESVRKAENLGSQKYFKKLSILLL